MAVCVLMRLRRSADPRYPVLHSKISPQAKILKYKYMCVDVYTRMHTSIIEIYAYIKIRFHVTSSEKGWYLAGRLASLLNCTKDADPFLSV